MSKTYNVGKEESQGGNSEISKLLLPISLQIMFQSKNEIDNKNSKHSYQNRFVSVKFSQYNYYYLHIVQQVHASKVGHGASQAIVGQGPANR
jgi:hypothetical protein